MGKFNGTERGDQQLLMGKRHAKLQKTGALEFECPGNKLKQNAGVSG